MRRRQALTLPHEEGSWVKGVLGWTGAILVAVLAIVGQSSEGIPLLRRLAWTGAAALAVYLAIEHWRR